MTAADRGSGPLPVAAPPTVLPPPALRPGDPPLAILVDYDGTIAQTDVSDTLLAEFGTPEWEAHAADYDAGRIGSRRLWEWELQQVNTTREAWETVAAAQPHDAGFATFARRVIEASIPIEVVSDGLGFFIPAALASIGMGQLPVITAETTFHPDGRPTIAFPNGHPSCFVCGTCKRNRVLAHQAAGRAVVFVGDGESDRYAAGYADLVFAKRALVHHCVENDWPFRRWTEFAEVDAWLAEVLAAWSLDPATPLLPRPASHRFFCGPEVWGEGRWEPPAVASRPG